MLSCAPKTVGKIFYAGNYYHKAKKIKEFFFLLPGTNIFLLIGTICTGQVPTKNSWIHKRCRAGSVYVTISTRSAFQQAQENR